MRKSLRAENPDFLFAGVRTGEDLAAYYASADLLVFPSLSYLRRFPIDRLKIDQSFVRDIQSTPVNKSIARAIVALAKSLSLGLAAEGIETQPEGAVLELMGCPEGQGYRFARPLSANDFFAWFTAHRKDYA